MKTSIDQLALWGGPKAIAPELLVGRPSTSHPDRIHTRIEQALARNWLTNDGPLVQELESRCAEFLGVDHCVAVNNATIGLQVVAHALGLMPALSPTPSLTSALDRAAGPGEVLVPSFTFVGTAHALSWMGLRPVFCDVHPDDHGLDPSDVERRITPQTRAILGVHLWGRGCQAQALEALGQRHGLPVFFDAAHAFGCSHDGRPIGHFGEAEVFSLHATKVMHSLEGGLITTRNAALADTLRLLRNYGFTAEDWSNTLGLNAKMSEFSAAVGLSNLEGLPELLAHNQRILASYRHGLAHAPGLTLLDARPGERFNHHYAVLQLTADCALPRDTLRHLLRAEGVYARRYFRPGCHHFPPYQTPDLNLPVTDQLSGSLLQLPTGWQVTPDTAFRIGEFLSWCLAHAGEIQQRLSSQAPD